MNGLRRLHSPTDVLKRAATAAAADPAALDACRQLLIGLRRADAERGSDLEKTLRTYYECGASVSATAEALFLHRNSVRYRLDRVRALVGGELEHPRTSAAFIVAFAIDDAGSTQTIGDEAQRAQ